MLPVKKDLFVFQGADFETSLELKTKNNNAFDLSGYVLSSQIKRFYNTDKIYNSSCFSPSPETGIININISNDVTTSMSEERYVYCITATKAEMVMTLAFGHILMERF